MYNDAGANRDNDKRPWYLRKLIDLNKMFTSREEESTLTKHNRRNLLFALWQIHCVRRVIESAFINENHTTASIGEILGISLSVGFLLSWISAFDNKSSLNKNVASIGTLVYLIGEIGNVYHHYLLSCFKKEAKLNNSKYAAIFAEVLQNRSLFACFFGCYS